MSDEDEAADRDHGQAGTTFVAGLLTGTVLGAGIAILFAPRPGADAPTPTPPAGAAPGGPTDLPPKSTGDS